MKRIVCGPRAVSEALHAKRGSIQLVIVDETTRGGRAIAREVSSKGVALRRSDKAELDALCGALHHQGVIAVTGDFPYLDLDSLMVRVERSSEPPLLLALDQVQDVQNVGSLVRSAVGLGAQGLILCRHGAAKLSAAAVRVSAGASEHAAIARVTNLSRALDELSDRGLSVVGLDANAPVELATVDLRGPLVLALGGEGSGLRRLVARSCHTIASIDLPGPVSSLNVGVAGAIALYEAARQRRKKA